MKSLAIFIRACCLILLGLLLYTEKSVAQSSSNGYNKEDYDGEYNYQEGEDYYGIDAENSRTRNSNIRRTAREEELYNGGYKNRASSTEAPGYSTFGLGSTSISGNRNRGQQDNSTNNNQPVSPDKDWRSIDNPSGANTENNPQVFNADGTPSGGGKEIDPGEKDPETPPPPPDEPDVPVDTAIPFLLIGGVILVYFKLRPLTLAS